MAVTSVHLGRREFLDYMVRQEVLQVQMTHASLVKEYAQITDMIDCFLAREG